MALKKCYWRKVQQFYSIPKCGKQFYKENEISNGCSNNWSTSSKIKIQPN